MITKNFNCGDYTIKAYYKKAGTGWEIGYKFNNKTCFVSNFIDRSEAAKWWMMSQKYMTTFCKNEIVSEMPMNFFGNFMGNFMYNHYYSFVKTVVAKHATYSFKNYKKDFARFNKFRTSYAA